jgi:cellobiose epimerase
MGVDGTHLEGLAEQAKDELLNRILPFWLSLEDEEYGSHYASMSYEGILNRSGRKSAVFVSRLLWFLSDVHRVLGHPEAADQAQRTKRFLLERLEDQVYGGLLWSVTRAGQPLVVEMHIYAQAFGIYALSAYARTFADADAAAAALRIFRIIVDRAFGIYGFTESYDRSWRETTNRLTSSSSHPAPRTMNTHLHVLEALTLLVRLDVDPAPRLVLIALLRLVLENFLSVDKTHSHSFLTERLTPLPGPICYGHDIEACWLIEAAADALADPDVSAEARAVVATLARATIAAGQREDGSFILEREVDGTLHLWRVWWVQAEALVGIVNEAQRNAMPDDWGRAERLWNYITVRMRGPTGDWHFQVGPDGAPDPTMPRVGPWKDPYHQARACLELIERARKHANTTCASTQPDTSYNTP